MAEAVLSAVVEHDVGGAISLLVASDGADGARCDRLGADGFPVFGEDVPLHRCEAQGVGDVEDGRAAGSVRCAEVADWRAEGVFENGVAVGELVADASGGLPGEPGVGHGVVADEVSGRGDGADDLRALTDVVADEEEGSAVAVAGEEVEKTLGDDVVGAVVEGEGDFVWVARGDEEFAEDLDWAERAA